MVDPLDPDLTLASHWVAVEAIEQWVNSHVILTDILLILLVVFGWPALCFFLWWLMAKRKGMTMKEYAKKHPGDGSGRHIGGD